MHPSVHKLLRFTCYSCILFLCSAAFAQRKPAEPVNLIYDSHIEGVNAKVQEAFVHSGRDDGGLYIPAVIMRPEGEGPFPVVLTVHGSPGGRDMSNLKTIIQTKGMVDERFLREGFMVVRCSYRWRNGFQNEPAGRDVASVIRFVKQLPAVDPNKVCIYAGSRGAENSVLALGEVSVSAAVLNAPAGLTYLGVFERKEKPKHIPGLDAQFPAERFDREVAISNLEKVNSPTRFVVGAEDFIFVQTGNATVSILKELGAETSIHFYPGERHGFYWGPSKENGTYNPSPGFINALDDAVAYLESKIR